MSRVFESYREDLEDQLDGRMNIIGQNGNDGLHYQFENTTMSTNGNVIWNESRTDKQPGDPNQLEFDFPVEE